ALMSDSVTPSRQGFLREVLFAAPTPRTPEYADYTPDSYHADKLDLAIGLPDEAVDCGTDLRGLLVVGPLGPLWAYHVVAFLADDDSVRMNTLVMPHARITGKATARLAPSTVESLYDALTNAPLMQPGQPIFPDSLDSLARDFSYTLLL